jgi:hypothetical protein
MLIIRNRKGSLRSQGSKGLSRHKPASLSRTWPFIPRSLHRPAFFRFWLLNRRPPERLCSSYKVVADKKQVCVFVTTKTTPMSLARGKLAIAPDGCNGFEENMLFLIKTIK